MKKFALLLLVWLFIASIADLCRAQSITATVRGLVTDSSGGVLPKAAISVRQVETGFARTVETDNSGKYEVSNLPPGTYEISAELAGFKRFVRKGITLSTGQESPIPIAMEVGEVNQQVVVTADAPLVDTTTAAVSGLVDKEAISEMPLNGRSFDQLAILNPGVTRYYNGGQNAQNGNGIKMSISGARPESTYFMLDGTNILDHSNFTPGSAAGNNLGVDAIREFRVFTHSYPAETGFRGGGAVSIVTRSGSNEFHGSAFEFVRNDNLDTRNFFDRGRPPEFKRNQFGFNLGGHIVRDKTFYFGAAEWLRERLGRTLRAVVPTAATRQGILPTFTVAVLPAVRPYLDLYPLPNGRDFGDGTGEYASDFSQPTNEAYFMTRIDHQFSSNDRLFGRFTFDNTTITIPAADLARFVTLSKSRNQFATAQQTHIFGPSAINEIRVAFNRTNPGQDGAGVPEPDRNLRFFPAASHVGELNFSPGRGPADGAAISAVGVGGNVPRLFTQNIIQIADSVSHRVRGHSLKYGTDIQRIQLNGILWEDTNGAYSFTGLVNLLRGTPATLQAPGPGSDFVRGFRQWLVGNYIQDEFQLKPNLTLNLGWRHEFTNQPTEVNGKIANLVNVMDAKPRKGPMLSENNSLRNFEPRFGFAWDPMSNGKMAITGGVGIFHSEVLGRNWYVYGLRQSPWSFLVFLNNPTFPNPFGSGANITTKDLQNDRIQPDLKTPTMYHYNVTLRNQISRDFALEIAYVGSKGIHLLRTFESNTPVPQILADGRLFYLPGSPRRNPNFGPIGTLASDAQSVYNALQAKVSKQYSRGLRFQATYSYSRSIDDASHLQNGQGNNSAAFSQNSSDRKSERGLSAFNISQALTLNFTYTIARAQSLKGIASALLNDWTFGGLFNATSGVPIDALTGFSRSGDLSNSVADRPDLKPGKSNNPVLGGPDRYFDPNVFSLPAAGFYGNVGRNTIIGPGLTTVDFTFSKQFRVRENHHLDYRFEAFNLLNHANFSLPRNRIFNAQGAIPGAVGRITATVTSSRQIQMSLRYTF